MWIIYNLAHKFTKIRSSDGDAWIRVLGFFAKQEEAIKYAKKYAEYDNIEIRISPQNQFKVMMKYDYKNDQLMLLREKEVNKYYMLLDLHKEKRSHAFKETYDNAKNHQVGKLKNNDESQIDEDLAKVEEEVFAKENNSFSQLNESVKNVTMTIRMQNFCGIAVIPDYLHIEEENKEFEDWERKRLLFYSGLRNRLVHEKQYKLCVSSLMHDWVKKNVPPNNANIYGQKMTNPETEMFSKIPENTSHLKSLLEGTAPSFPGKPAQTPEERELMWGAKHRHFDNLVKGAELSQQNKIKNGEIVFDSKNQPHRGNEGFFGRTKRGRRLYTDSNGVTSPTNNLGASISQGRFKRLGEE